MLNVSNIDSVVGLNQVSNKLARVCILLDRGVDGIQLQVLPINHFLRVQGDSTQKLLKVQVARDIMVHV